MDYPALGPATGFDDPRTQGILALAAGLLQAGGPTRYPTSFGTALGQAMGSANKQQQQQTLINLEQQKGALTAMQVGHMQYQSALQSWLLNGRKGPPPTPPTLNFPGMPTPVAQPAPAQTAAAGPTPAGPTPPGMSAATSNLVFGTPQFGSQAPAQPPAQSNDAIGNLPQYAQDALAYNMAFPGAGAIIMDANKPIPMRQGPLVSPSGNIIFQNTPPVPGVNFDYGPGGRVTGASQIPNFAPSVAAIEGAKATATAEAHSRERTVEVTTADGRKVRVPESTITGASPRPAPFGPPRPTPGPGQGITPAKETAQKANEEELAKEASQGRVAANLAVDTNYNLQRVIEASSGFDTGKFTSNVMGIKSFLQGVAPDLFPEKDMAKLSSFQEFNKYSIRLGFDQARKMGARESTQIVQMSIESNPNPNMVKPAITAIANGLMAQNDYIIAKEKARDAYFTKNQQLGGFNSEWQAMADPRAFLLVRQDPTAQAKLISSLSEADRKKLTNSLTALRKAGIL